MNFYSGLISFFSGLMVFSACSEYTPTANAYKTVRESSKMSRIAFGSCGSEDHQLPIFNNIVEADPDLFIFLGDNIYGDTKNMNTLRNKYQKLEKKASFQNLKTNIPIIATWDDHDYGWNDVGKEWVYKEESKEIFLDFFAEPMDSERRKHAGIYHSYEYAIGSRKLQIILLDVRTFREGLKKYDGEHDDDWRFSFYKKDYTEHTTPDSAFLGEAQWAWLETQLQKPADIRLIGSGVQFGVEWNGYEAWINFPHEQQRMLNLIKKTRANGVMFLTGDVHYSEISKLKTDFYPIYDFTSSGLSSTWHFATPNRHRIEGPVMDNHFSLITIDWDRRNPSILMETFDVSGNRRIEYEIKLDEISFKRS